MVRYVKNTFDPASESTIGASFLAKKVVVDDCLVRLQVWVLLMIRLSMVIGANAIIPVGLGMSLPPLMMMWT